MDKYIHILTDEEISESDYSNLTHSEQLDYKKVEESEFGNPMLMSDGHLGLNMGNGLSLDTSDGKLGINIGGIFSIDL